MSEHLSNAPVYYALVQAHFNPIAAMANYTDRIQDVLRRQGYPLFEKQQTTHLVVHNEGKDTEPQVKHATSWLLSTNDRNSGFILSQSSITFHTTHYQTHVEFITELLRGLQAVHKVVELDHISRLGLRYLNAVLPKSDEKVEDYLIDGLHGLSFPANRIHGMNESVFTTNTGPLLPAGTLVVRAYRMTSLLGFPPDMIPQGLSANQKFVTTEPCEHSVIDLDHYAEGQMPVDQSKLEAQLISLHETITSAFKATTTDFARKTWL